MPEHVAAAIDAGTFAIPDADHAIMPRTGREIELLRSPDRRGSEILIHPGLEFDVVLFKVFARRHQLLVIAAEGGAAIAGNKACGIEACGAVATNLRHRQPHQRLYPGHE